MDVTGTYQCHESNEVPSLFAETVLRKQTAATNVNMFNNVDEKKKFRHHQHVL
jgi:hypothetical protein